MSYPSSLSLASPIVINTRPVERAEPLTHHLQAAGLTVVDIPMLALQSRPTSAADMSIMRRWLAGDYQALVIVSPTAAAAGLAIWQALEQETQTSNIDEWSAKTPKTSSLKKVPSHIIAVGDATAFVLQQASYQALQPTIANNEGMLAMPEIDRLQAGDKLLVWRGLGGRRLLVDTLQARGVHIDSIAWYERTLPIDADTNYQRWLGQFSAQYKSQSQHSNQLQPSHQSKQPNQAPPLRPIVVISSGTAFEHWSNVVSRAQSTEVGLASTTLLPLKLSDFTYIVLGERLAEMVAAEKLCYWRIEDLSPTTILQAIEHGNLQTAKK